MTIGILPFTAARLGEANVREATLAIQKAMALCSDSLYYRILLCAFIGALDHEAECSSKTCKTMMKLVKQLSIHNAIFTTLEEIMQVWSSIILLHLVTAVHSKPM